MLGVLSVVLGASHPHQALLGKLQLLLGHAGQRGTKGGKLAQNKSSLREGGAGEEMIREWKGEGGVNRGWRGGRERRGR